MCWQTQRFHMRYDKVDNSFPFVALTNCPNILKLSLFSVLKNFLCLLNKYFFPGKFMIYWGHTSSLKKGKMIDVRTHIRIDSDYFINALNIFHLIKIFCLRLNFTLAAFYLPLGHFLPIDQTQIRLYLHRLL